MKNSLKVLTILSVVFASWDANGMNKFWKSIKSCCSCCDTVDLSENQLDDIELQLNDLGFRDDMHDLENNQPTNPAAGQNAALGHQGTQSSILTNIQNEVFTRLNEVTTLRQNIQGIHGLQEAIERHRNDLSMVSSKFLDTPLEEQCEDIIRGLNEVSITTQELLNQLHAQNGISEIQIKEAVLKMTSIRSLHTMCELLYLQGRIHIND